MLKGEQAKLGRPRKDFLPDIDLSDLPNSQVVSRYHADIRWDPFAKVYQIIDNQSANQTFVNGRVCTPQIPYELTDGTIVQLGQDGLVQLRVVLT